MANFCKYCGKSLVNGLCDCAAGTAGQSQTTPIQETPLPPVQPSQSTENAQSNDRQFQSATAQQAPNNQFSRQTFLNDDTKSYLLDAKNITLSMIKCPVSTLSQVQEEKKSIPGIILFAIHILLFWLCTSINIPVFGAMMKSEDRIKAGLFLSLMAGAIIIIFALAGMLLGKKSNSTFTFMDSLAVFGSATVPGTILFLVAFILGFFSVSLPALLLFTCYFAWLYMSNEAMNVIIKLKRNSNFWIVLFLQIAYILLIVMISKEMVTKAIQDLSSSFSSLLGGFL